MIGSIKRPLHICKEQVSEKTLEIAQVDMKSQSDDEGHTIELSSKLEVPSEFFNKRCRTEEPQRVLYCSNVARFTDGPKVGRGSSNKRATFPYGGDMPRAPQRGCHTTQPA